MGAALLMLLQAAAASPPERIDLTLPASMSRCDRAVGDEIVVCGGREDPYRLSPVDDRFAVPPRRKAEIDLFGGAARCAVETEAVAMPGGMQSNRLMARLRLPF